LSVQFNLDSLIQFCQFSSIWTVQFNIVGSIEFGKSRSAHLKSFFQNKKFVSDIFLETNSYSGTDERL